MYEVAEQQLALVCKKTQQLGEALQRQIDALKKLRANRHASLTQCDELRRLLREAEARANAADRAHDEAERCLKRTAEEFAATQLLQKRYENTLADLEGRQRAIVRVAGAAAHRRATAWDGMESVTHPSRSDESSAPAPTQSRPHHHHHHEQQQQQHYRASIAVSDECTVVELERRRTFVVDVAYTASSLRQRMQTETGSATSAASGVFIPASMHDEELSAAIRMEQVISDVLSGVNTIFVSFGPSGGGKTEVLYGTKAATLEYEKLQQQQLFHGTRRSSSRGRLSSALPSVSSGCGNKEQTAGLLSIFVNGLFDSLVVQSVTHFNIRCSFAEVALNQTVDLLLHQYPPGGSSNKNKNDSSASGGGSTLVKMVSAVASAAAAATTTTTSGGVSPGLMSYDSISEEVTAVKVETADEVMRVFFDGLERLGRWRHAAPATFTTTSSQVAGGVSDNNNYDDGRNKGSNTNGSGDHSAAIPHRGGVSHAIFTLSVESFNSKGHYRRAMVSFVDLCGSPPRAVTRAATPANATEAMTLPSTLEVQWVEESLQALCDAIAATSSVRRASSSNAAGRSDATRAVTVFDRLPSAHTNCIARFLRPIFGGNAKAVMVCCVDALQHTKEEVLNSLSYAYFFKRIQHHAVPYDIPPELQRLNLQMNAFFPGITGDGGYEEDDDDDDDDGDDDFGVGGGGSNTNNYTNQKDVLS